MKEKKKHTHQFEVPRGTGIQGFLRVIEGVLKLDPYDVRIDMRGKVTYTLMVPEGSPEVPLNIDFETLRPYDAIRNGDVVELIFSENMPASLVVAMMFREVTADQLFPIAFVGGAQTDVWKWLQKGTFLVAPPSKDEFFGRPYFKDRMIEDSTLFLCAGYSRDAAIIDTQKSYKIILPTI